MAMFLCLGFCLTLGEKKLLKLVLFARDDLSVTDVRVNRAVGQLTVLQASHGSG